VAGLTAADPMADDLTAADPMAADLMVDDPTVDDPTEDEHQADDHVGVGHHRGDGRPTASRGAGRHPACRVDAAGRSGLAATDDRRGRDCRPEPRVAFLRGRGSAVDPSGAGDRRAAADRFEVLVRIRRDELAGRFPVVRAAGPREAGA
jgi:hypothetical protein